ncbi:MAG: hypothetical protein J6M02_06205 [Clostridia bacterium]|nr:hypothetical protein [Clostridia bacterium]
MILYLEIIAVILLLSYYLGWFIHDYVLYRIYTQAMQLVGYLFQVSSCIIEEKENTSFYTLYFTEDTDIPEKKLQPVIGVFKQFYLKGAIVSLEEEGAEFVPCFYRDLMKGIMEELINSSAKLICDYWEWDFITRFLLEKKYNDLQKALEEFAEQHERVCQAAPGSYFCINSE